MSRRAWRPTLATVALMVYAIFVFYFLVTVVLPWATQGLGEPWDFSRVDM